MDKDDSKFGDRQLVVRESDVRATIAKLEREETELKDRLIAVSRDLEANRVLLGYFPSSARSAPDSHPTIREMAIEVLNSSGRPMGVREMIDAIELKYGADVPRTSLSPILKKMEGRGLVEHVGSTWISKRKGPSAPTGDPTGDDASPELTSQPSSVEERKADMS